MTGWYVAITLYILPVLAGLRHYPDEVEDVKEWMRGPDGEWFPELAPFVAMVSIFAWPIVAAGTAFWPTEKD